MTSYRLYRWLSAIVLFVLLFDSPIVLAQGINIDAARKEGKVIAYGTIIPQVMEPLHRNLEKKFGIKVEYWRASATQVMERSLSEWQAGRPGFDLTFAINGAQAILKQAGGKFYEWRLERGGDTALQPTLVSTKRFTPQVPHPRPLID